MKTKLLFLGLLLGVSVQSYAQPAVNPSALPYYEGFDYPVGGNLIGQGNWDVSGTGTFDETIQDGSLTYAGLPTSTGSSLNFRGGGPDPVSYFTPQTDGTLYYSFLVRINPGTTDFYGPGVNSTGIQFISLGLQNSALTGTNYGSNIMIRRTDATNEINFGYNIDSQTNNSVWHSANIELETTYFVVASFTFDSSAPSGKMWLNPVVNGVEPAATISSSLFTNNRSTLDRIFIRQDSNARTPDMTLDEIRVGTTWASVTNPSLSVAENVLNSVSIYPNPATNLISISSNETEIKNVNIFTLEGKKVMSITNPSNQIDVSSLSTGLYLVQLNNETATTTKKLTIK